MESRSPIVAVILVALAGCSSENADALFGTPADSGAGGEDPGSGGTAGSRSGNAGVSGSSTAGRAGSGTAGASGSTASGGGGTGGSGTGGSSPAGEGGSSGTDPMGGSSTGAASGTGGSSGGTDPMGGRPSGGRSGAGGSGGSGPVNCRALLEAYEEALEEAQTCNPNLDTEQCTKHWARSDLECGCSTFVNPQNESALAELEKLEEKANLECEPTVCPAIACIPPSRGVCSSSGEGSGHCVDVFSRND